MKRLRHFLPPAVVVLPLMLGAEGCATTMPRRPSAADSTYAVVRLDGITEDYSRFLLAIHPEVSSRASNFVTNLPDPSLDRTKKDAQFARAALVALDEINVNALSQDDYVTWLAMRWEMEALSGWSAFHWTDFSDLAPGHSVFDESLNILKSQGLTDAAGNLRFGGLVANIAKLADAVRAEYAERAKRDIRLPKQLAARAAMHVRSFMAPAFASPFLTARDSQPASDTTGQTLRVTELADMIIVRRVNPALDSLANFLDSEQGRSSDSLGLVWLPGGAEHYAALLRYRSTVAITPEEAHAVGVREVARLSERVAAARNAARLPANRDSLRVVMRRDSRFVFDERSSIPERAAQLFEGAAKSLDSLFGGLPASALSIGAMRTVSDLSPLATYEWPTLNRPSARYLLSIEKLASRSAMILPGMIASDLMPGMHLQQGSQLQNTELPAFRRLAMNDGFVKGWSLYALDVADSVMTTLEPWQHYSLRLRELSAACGLVVDTGINALGWSYEDALNFLRSVLPDDDDDLAQEFIFPAAERPGELSAGTLGAREFRGLRRWAMRELGDRFSLPAFHAEVLRIGSVPLPVLGSHLERWIWDLNHPPAPPAARR